MQNHGHIKRSRIKRDRGMNRQKHRGFLRETMKLNTYYYAFVKPTECIIARMNSDANSRDTALGDNNVSV
jgi:hypothetical protein